MAKPQLAELMRFTRDGDTVVVHSLDRLARSEDDLRSWGPDVDQCRCARGVR
ncbi:recombinase family protein [Arthrobacter sp. ZGTC412]|uniref:recombinase family protein n=1 Tax=Arthrobacter sp. ZGTC412 TaxID=2058900 RepID=UPI003F8D48E7